MENKKCTSSTSSVNWMMEEESDPQQLLSKSILQSFSHIKSSLLIIHPAPTSCCVSEQKYIKPKIGNSNPFHWIFLISWLQDGIVHTNHGTAPQDFHLLKDFQTSHL